ncbi:hypothetical protein L207DRAFT_468350 [Hyaloscypha variabilis F]|uniref:Uncharacterized protein n=1 Tax=Hyaloscypha variabilis (strain UAMH 11265 / GT02V1 / F) TaxID=1149755 RepID=A0A2J6R6N0_HYAVF|nr:hypothetical protein L207DRAFT_468350 [Hyaloscypha variabilis F]
MPEHNGIKLSVFSQVEQTIHPELPHLHPEFPHPETSQFTYRSPDVRNSVDWSPPSAGSDSKADRLLGKRFWVRYSIDEWAATQSQWYFFKLFMNGRQVTSWGTNARANPSGHIMKGLFDPSDLWNYEHSGIMYKNMGLEQRSFFFAFEEQDQRSAARDGGLIEVKVYRARGRSRKMPSPPDFRRQDDYGITMPSQGLVDRPQEAKFYDWHLKDPKDLPYSTFKFHYRSWESLESLNLIPSDHPRVLLPPSASVLSLVGLPREDQDTLQEEALTAYEGSPAKASETSESSAVPWLTSVFDESPESATSHDGRECIMPSEILENYALRFPATIPTSKFSTAVIDKSASPNGSPVPINMNRALPQIPSRKSSLKHKRNQSSISTNAPSVAASLKSYYDRNCETPEPAELGIAEVVQVAYPSPVVATTERNIDNASIQSLHIVEPPEDSPLAEIANKRRGMALELKPGTFSIPNVTIRKFRLSRSNSSPVGKTTPAKTESHKENEPTPLLDNQTTLSLTESEWMCRTPSPVRRSLQDDGFSASKLWSPGLGANRKSPRDRSEGSSVRRSTSLLRQRVVGIPEEASDNPGQGEIEDEEKLSGNWI